MVSRWQIFTSCKRPVKTEMMALTTDEFAGIPCASIRPEKGDYERNHVHLRGMVKERCLVLRGSLWKSQILPSPIR